MQVKNGIILLGGNGTRLAPATAIYNKHLVYLHNKLVVDYSLGTLQSLGCKNVSVILGGDHWASVAAYLQDGARYNMHLNYVFQPKADGISSAINLCRRFVADEEQFAVVLGDSFFDKPVSFSSASGAQIILHRHPQLSRFGVASVANECITKIEEKPKVLIPSIDQYAITGCYLFDQQFFKFFECIKPSARAEFEITDVLQLYLDDQSLSYSIYDAVWSDVGTNESLQAIQNLLYTKETK